MTAPCAIEYILVTRWRGGKKGGQNRVCACDTRDRGVNKKLKPEHPSETVVMPESGERKRNLTQRGGRGWETKNEGSAN